MPLFDFQPKSTKFGDSNIIGKTNQKISSPVKMKSGETLRDRIKNIEILVEKHLGSYREQYLLIKEEEQLREYLRVLAEDYEFAVDTETSSLDPITCTLAGISLYSPSNKPAYVPLNHISNMTGMRLTNQLTPEQFTKAYKEICNKPLKSFMFNAKFDMRVLRHQANFVTEDNNYLLKAAFDGHLAAKCLNENEPAFGLKPLYTKYCLGGKGDSFSFSDLFNGIPFIHIPMDIGYLYAAHDAKITYELCKHQEQFLDINNEACISRNLQNVAKVFHEIEMPIIETVAKMQDTGINIDLEYQKHLQVKYQALLDEKRIDFYKVCDLYDEEIKNHRKNTRNTKLENPINISSPIQISELFFDVLNLPDKSKKRSTQEKFIKDINHDAVSSLLKYREFEKLMTTYIVKMPEVLNAQTGKIHCNFNQYGAVTGRFSSDDPNMQNIPSKNKDIRPMFVASKDCVLMSSDYSKQEAIIAAVMSKDARMLQAINEGKDIYSAIAAIAFNCTYEECCEFNLDGSVNKAGKERRNKSKAIVLGVMYGKQIKSIAEDLGVTVQVAQQIYNTIMAMFPGLQDFMINSQQMAIDYGFVTTFWGRKRRLPDMQLPKYEFSWINGVSNNFDPIFDDESVSNDEVDEETKNLFTNMLDKAYGYKAKQKIYEMAKNENIKIKDNTMLIAEAERQCVNSRVQGSAADLTKIAMQFIGENQKLKDLGFKLILQVHDELIAECPKNVAKECADLFSLLMSEAGMDLGVRLKCDVTITERWCGEEVLV